MDKNWARMTVGGKKGIDKTLARKLDGFGTPKIATLELIRREKFQTRIWEPAAGYHHIAGVLRKNGFKVYTSDIHRWRPETIKQRAFQRFSRLPLPFRESGCSIITNPPFKKAQIFLQHAMRLLKDGDKLALLLRVQFLEGQKRKLIFEEFPPMRVWVFSYRIPRMHIFNYTGKKSGGVLSFAWFVWKKGYEGPTIIKWI